MNDGPERPNLFEFATSELSQDAFLCWLIEHADYAPDAETQRLGREFVAMLYRVGTGDADAEASSVGRLLAEPGRRATKRQYRKIDVYFRAVVKGRTISFVIEDKTGTEQHGDQLGRYKAAVMEDDVPEDGLALVYLKNGYVFSDERRAVANAAYGCIDYRGLYEFFLDREVPNVILSDYRRSVLAKHREIETALARLATDAGHEVLDEDFVQAALIENLQKACGDGPWAIERGRNLGGTPFITATFSRRPSARADAGDEMLYWRVDSRADGWTLALCQSDPVRGDEAATLAKLARRDEFRRVFDEVRIGVGGDLTFGRPSPRGVVQSDIGVVPLGPPNTIPSVLALLPALHRQFVSRLPG